MDPHTGAIRAMIGGNDYRKSVFNRAIQAKRQPGSAFKPIIYAAAIENGYTMADVFLDSPVVYPDPTTGKPWRPANFSGKFRGPTTLHTALMYSINVVTIKLLEKLGIQPVVSMARRLGITTPIKPNLSLGAEAVLVVVVDRKAVATGDVEADAPTQARRDLEARRIDDAVDRVFDAVGHHARLGDPLDALRLATSTRVTFGRLKVGRYSSLKVGRLQNCRYQGFSASAVAASCTVSSTRRRILFIFTMSASSAPTIGLARRCRSGRRPPACGRCRSSRR